MSVSAAMRTVRLGMFQCNESPVCIAQSMVGVLGTACSHVACGECNATNLWRGLSKHNAYKACPGLE